MRKNQFSLDKYSGILETEKVINGNMKENYQIKSLSIIKAPDIKVYAKDEKMNLSGGKILVEYNGRTSEEISMNSMDVKVTGFESKNIGTKQLTVTYKDMKVGTFSVEVKEQFNKPQSISLSINNKNIEN